MLLALTLVSILSVLAWRVIDGMSRAGEITQDSIQQSQRLQVTLAQWTADLDAITDAELNFDGQSLFLVRRSALEGKGIEVVAWRPRSVDGILVLQRWASLPVTTQLGRQNARDAAMRWSRTPLPEDAPRTVGLIPINSWEIFYFRGNAWTNPQSAAATNALPDGVRLELDLPSGRLTKLWVNPILGATK